MNKLNSIVKSRLKKSGLNKSTLHKSLLSIGMLGTALSSSNVYSFDVEHEAHVHGHASLNVVIEGKELQIAFKSPAMNIVGFEHAPKSAQDKNKVKDALIKLKNSDLLFNVDSAAGCEFENVHVSSALMEAHHDHHDEHKHDKHHDDHHDEHEHDKHHDDHHDEHDHDKHEGHSDEHSEFEAEYHFECKDVNKITKIDVGLFKAFPSLDEVEAQVITKNRQKLVELKSGHATVEF